VISRARADQESPNQRRDLRVQQVAAAERSSNGLQTAGLSAEFNWEAITLA
jgi:hypothetical protein